MQSHRSWLWLLWLLFTPWLHAGERPALMLATPWRDAADVADYWVSEKLDGVRARWDGHRLITRGGETIQAPQWFLHGWPAEPMDGELWIARGRFDEVSALVRTGEPANAGWRQVHFMVFDLPAHPGPFGARVQRMRAMLRTPAAPGWLKPIAQYRVQDAARLQAGLKAIVAAGGEGLMLHHQNAHYAPGRSEALMKLKPFEDADARVIAHLPGRGRHAGRLGALEVQMDTGRRFRLGIGFTDAQREHPPPIGSRVTFRYSGLTRQGLPRFARFLRIRDEEPHAHAR